MSDPASLDPHIRHRRRPQTNESIRSQGSSRLRRRLHTWGSTRSSASQGSQGSQRTNITSSASGGLVQNYYPCYGLDWETLKEYLMEVWPDLDFEEPLSTDNDQFVFETPSPGLTEMDRVKIAGLRRKVLARRPSVSPERPSRQAA
ncbi:hypothetical protein QBC37DRAFT_431677 [Rhypophila decipiens]|uniref:Uncharacterized protein n=1 Tax=Rhypophila decipiens TaxID=261697 RepID=A0AAN6XXZ9_9PEZI|nr:hypothetical protein QBC37DRAFT_431677 [Rhypophila decipiens]